MRTAKIKLLVALAIIAGSSAYAATLATASIGTQPTAVMPANFLGLANEWCKVQTVLGTAGSGGTDAIYQQLVANLNAYGAGPMYMRIGGNSTDTGSTCSTPTGIQSVQAMNEFATATGSKFTFGVNLLTANLAASQAQATAYCAGMPSGTILGFEIGNEPDFYTTAGYNAQTYYTQLAQWLAGIQSAQPCIKVMVAPSCGSFNCSGVGMTASIPGIFVTSYNTGLGIASMHYYSGNSPQSSGYLLTSAANNGPSRILPKMQSAHALGMTFRLDEMNSLNGGGSTLVSNAFESALWFMQNAMNYAAEGVDGLNVQGSYLSGANYTFYNPFSITAVGGGVFNLSTVNGGQPAIAPLYDAMVFFQRATSGAATFYPVTLSTTAAVSAWSTVDSGSNQRLIVVNRDTTNSGNVIVANAASTASVCYLSAPAFSSLSGVQVFANAAGSTFQSFESSTTGAPTGSAGFDVLTPSAGSFTFPMTTAQAAIVKFGSSSGC